MEHDLLVISNAKAGSADEDVLPALAFDVLRRGGTDVRSEPLSSPDQRTRSSGRQARRSTYAVDPSSPACCRTPG